MMACLLLIFVQCLFLFIRLASFFVGHRQLVQTQIRRLIRVFTVCLHNVILKKIKMKYIIRQPLPQKWTGPIDKRGKFISIKWVNIIILANVK